MSTKAFPFTDNSHLIVVQYINKQLVTDDRANQINTELKKNIIILMITMMMMMIIPFS